jgi:hypothetical protein
VVVASGSVQAAAWPRSLIQAAADSDAEPNAELLIAALAAHGLRQR